MFFSAASIPTHMVHLNSRKARLQHTHTYKKNLKKIGKRKGESKGSWVSLHPWWTLPVTQRHAAKLHLLKVSQPPIKTRAGTTHLTHGPLRGPSVSNCSSISCSAVEIQDILKNLVIRNTSAGGQSFSPLYKLT